MCVLSKLHASQGTVTIMTNETTKVIAGVDTHADTHHVGVINEHNKQLA